MGLQLANLASQIKLNESQANKNNAEANKTAGVDTELAKTAFTNYDELIFRLTSDSRKAVSSCTYTTKEFYEMLNGKGQRVYVGGFGGDIATNSAGPGNYYWGFETFNNPFTTFKSTVNYLCTDSGTNGENCGLVEIYGVTYPRA